MNREMWWFYETLECPSLEISEKKTSIIVWMPSKTKVPIEFSLATSFKKPLA